VNALEGVGGDAAIRWLLFTGSRRRFQKQSEHFDRDLYSPGMKIGPRTQLTRKLCRTISFIAMVFLTGCSSFEREWKQAASAGQSGLAGRWQGTWASDVNGHHGKLRCVVSQIEGPEYRARFRATYQTVLHFSYNVNLHVERQGNEFKFQGEADLGLAGGVYHYVGQAEGSNFLSTYSCASDHGTFQMTRP
jgi:hypothetical protein